jgi:hypothetical protein
LIPEPGCEICPPLFSTYPKGRFVEGGANTVRLYRAGESPLVLVDTVAFQSQTPDHCWAAVTDASPTYVQKYPPTVAPQLTVVMSITVPEVVS